MSDPLVLSTDVQAVGSFDVTDFDPYIAAAHTVVETLLLNLNLSDDLLKLIETYLAAHFTALKDPRVRQVAMHSANITYALPAMGAGFAGTIYGQTALALDYTNTLSSLGRNKASIRMA